MNIFNKKLKSNDVLEIIAKKSYFSRFLLMCFGMLLIAIGFNIFLLPFNLVPGGVSSLSIIMNKLTSISPSSFLYMANAVLLYLALFVLGPKFTIKTFFVSMILPFFIDVTSILNNYIVFGQDKLILVCIYAGLLSGLGTGLVYKAGFTTGGSDIIRNILMKKSNVPIGKAIIIIDGIIVIFGTIVFRDPLIFMYSIIIIFISSITAEKIILGISNNKAFYIISKHAEEIADFASNNLYVKSSIMEVKGSLRHINHDMMLIIVPTKDYYLLKEAIQIIDSDAFFTIIDVYQTYGLENQMLKIKENN